MSEKKVLGEYLLKKFEISNGGSNALDLSNIITEWNIVENIFDGYLHGSALIADTKNQVQNFPFNGEERIHVEYEDYFGVTLSHTFFIYNVEHFQMRYLRSDQVQEYKLHFCSPIRVLSGTQKVKKGNQGLISDFAKSIFKTYYEDIDKISKQKKEIDVQTTSGTIRLVVPAYDPLQAMHFLTRHSYSSSKSSLFRFFETRQKFYFATPEYFCEKSMSLSRLGKFGQVANNLLNKQKQMSDTQKAQFWIYSPSDFDSDEIDYRMMQILGLKYLYRSDTVDDYNKGTYHRRVIHLDFKQRELYEKTYKFPKDMNQYFPGSKMHTRHGQNFVEAMFPEPYDLWVIKDWTDSAGVPDKPDPNHEELYGPKSMQLLHDVKNEIQIVVYGRNTVFAGSVVELKVPEFSERTEYKLDKEREGFYMVSRCNNEFTGDGYKQTLTLTRTGQLVDLSKSKWPKVPRITPDEQIGKEPVYGAKGTNTKTANKATGQPTGQGTSRGGRNNNPGNIRDGEFAKNQPGYVGSDGAFAIFDTPENGAAAQQALLQSYLNNGFNTPESIINRWAPSSENDVNGYLNFITNTTGFAPDQVLTSADIPTLSAAMARMEVGNADARIFYPR